MTNQKKDAKGVVYESTLDGQFEIGHIVWAAHASVSQREVDKLSDSDKGRVNHALKTGTLTKA